MRETKITFICDRCGATEQRDADVRIAHEELPARWAVIAIEGVGTHDRPELAPTNMGLEVCNECRESFFVWRKEKTEFGAVAAGAR